MHPNRVDFAVDLAYGLLLFLAIVLIVTVGTGIGIAFGLGALVSYVVHVVWKMARFDPEWMTEEITERVEETLADEVTESVGEQVAAEVTENVTDQVTEEVTENVTDQVTETVGEQVEEMVEQADEAGSDPATREDHERADDRDPASEPDDHL
jgi:hypothetical protein